MEANTKQALVVFFTSQNILFSKIYPVVPQVGHLLPFALRAYNLLTIGQITRHAKVSCHTMLAPSSFFPPVRLTNNTRE